MARQLGVGKVKVKVNMDLYSALSWSHLQGTALFMCCTAYFRYLCFVMACVL